MHDCVFTVVVFHDKRFKNYSIGQICEPYFVLTSHWISVILLQIVMVSPGTQLMKNHEPQSITIESQFKNVSPRVFM